MTNPMLTLEELEQQKAKKAKDEKKLTWYQDIATDVFILMVVFSVAKLSGFYSLRITAESATLFKPWSYWRPPQLLAAQSHWHLVIQRSKSRRIGRRGRRGSPPPSQTLSR